jgi:type 1 fimbriae regulatory protein FimB/type 1 fimbriae regulatory protein FimE
VRQLKECGCGQTTDVIKSPTPSIRKVGSKRNATGSRNGRKKNTDYRVHEHLTEDQMAKLLAALKRNRHGHRDWLIGLLIYRHGLRVSEACDLR